MINVEEIKARYPNPVKGYRSFCGGYCIGGALCGFLGDPQADFPNKSRVADELKKANPNIKNAWEYAITIVNYNDDGEFDKAWAVLKEALEYGN